MAAWAHGLPAPPSTGRSVPGASRGGLGGTGRMGASTHVLCSLWYFHHVLRAPLPGPGPCLAAIEALR